MTRSFNYQDLIVVNTLVDSKKTPENFTDRVSFEYSSPGLTCRHKHPMTRLFCRSGLSCITKIKTDTKIELYPRKYCKKVLFDHNNNHN